MHDDDYYIEAMQTWINLDYNAEWKVVNVLPDIQYIYNGLNKFYFEGSLPGLTVRYSSNLMNKNFYSLSLQENLLLFDQNNLFRPRIDLFSAMLHAMIHLFIHKKSKESVGIAEHDSNFHKLTLHFNRLLRLNISVTDFLVPFACNSLKIICCLFF